MGEELFNILQKYGLVGADQQFDLGELLVRADDSFSIPDPTQELADIAERAGELASEIELLNGTITTLDAKIEALDEAIRETTDPVLRASLLDQRNELEQQREVAMESRDALLDEATGLAAQFAQAKATADRLGLSNVPNALASQKNMQHLQTAVALATDRNVNTSVQDVASTLKQGIDVRDVTPQPTAASTPT